MRQKESVYDVAVVGAGPAGSMAAFFIARKGYRVALLEEHARPGEPVNCSGIIGSEAFDRFELPRAQIVRPIHALRFYSPSGKTLGFETTHPLAMTVDRSAFDIALCSNAIAEGTELITDSRVTDILIESDRVKLTVNRGQSELAAKFVVLATGAGSPLTRQIGLEGLRHFVQGVQTECRMHASSEVEIHLGRHVAPSNFAWVVPLQDGWTKIGLLSRTDGANALRGFLESNALKHRILCPPNRVRCSLLPLETLKRCYTDRIIVIGEAAGQIKTSTCGGIYYGILAAEIGADVIDAALQNGRTSIKTLGSYETRWRALLQEELRVGFQLRSLFENLSDDQIDALFALARRNGIMDIIRKKANFDWHLELISSVLRHSMINAFFHPLSYAETILQ